MYVFRFLGALKAGWDPDIKNATEFRVPLYTCFRQTQSYLEKRIDANAQLHQYKNSNYTKHIISYVKEKKDEKD
jgi:hypothetical protein